MINFNGVPQSNNAIQSGSARPAYVPAQIGSFGAERYTPSARLQAFGGADAVATPSLWARFVAFIKGLFGSSVATAATPAAASNAARVSPTPLAAPLPPALAPAPPPPPPPAPVPPAPPAPTVGAPFSVGPGVGLTPAVAQVGPAHCSRGQHAGCETVTC
jgi:hypothetical protein